MSNITLPPDMKSLKITSQHVDEQGNIVLSVKSKNDHAACQKHGKPATKPNEKGPQPRILQAPFLNSLCI